MLERRWSRAKAALGAALLGVIGNADLSRADDGVIEINQASALAGFITPGDGPGFPVVLAKSGSFRLTSNLDVPSSTDGIVISSAGVTLDLNGFALASTYQCCASGGTGNGVSGAASRTTVVNGEVAGFAQRGLVLGSFSHVERVVVRQVGTHGIALGDGSIALSNRVTQVGESALLFTGTLPGVYRDNVLANAALVSGSTARAVDGLAHASGGNFCADQSCSTRGTRRYYLEDDTADGNEALGACEPGFHFASIHEIRDTAALEYDPVRGVTYAQIDSAVGGPTTTPALSGWVRNGEISITVGGLGRENCALWQSDSASHSGTVALPDNDWSTATEAGHWAISSRACSLSYSVWCIED